jgi:hypothetical protein
MKNFHIIINSITGTPDWHAMNLLLIEEAKKQPDYKGSRMEDIDRQIMELDREFMIAKAKGIL